MWRSAAGHDKRASGVKNSCCFCCSPSSVEGAQDSVGTLHGLVARVARPQSRLSLVYFILVHAEVCIGLQLMV